MKKVLKIVGLVILVIIILIVLIVGFLLIKNYIDSQKPWLEKDYYNQFQSDSELEKKYAGLGDYEVSSEVVKSEDKTIGNIRIWYPSEMKNSQDDHPMVVVVNGSNTAALNYEAYFERLASWQCSPFLPCTDVLKITMLCQTMYLSFVQGLQAQSMRKCR